MRETSNRKLSKHSWKPQDTVIVFGNEETKRLFRKIFFSSYLWIKFQFFCLLFPLLLFHFIKVTFIIYNTVLNLHQ